MLITLKKSIHIFVCLKVPELQIPGAWELKISNFDWKWTEVLMWENNDKYFFEGMRILKVNNVKSEKLVKKILASFSR